MKIQLSFILTFFVLFLFSTNELIAQDKIHFKKEGKIVKAKIIEVGTAEIKYKFWEEDENGLIYVVEKSTISFIEFESGRKEYFGEALLDQEDNFLGQKRRAIKISWAGFLSGYSTVAYEQILKPGRSMEYKANLIGLGKQTNRDAKGIIGTFGYRFYRKPTFTTSNLRRTNILQGMYFKPEVFLGRTSYNSEGFFGNGSDKRESSTTVGAMINGGRQMVMGDVFIIDVGFGIGYGFGTSYKSYFVSDEANLAFTFTLDIGLAY